MNSNIVWAIAASDSSGGAGIQMDLITLQNLGVHGCTVLTAVTAQNHSSVAEVYYLSSELISSQINSLKTTLYPKTIKLGVLGKAQTVKTIFHFLENYNGHVILDPLLLSTSSKKLYDGNLNDYLRQLKFFLPQVTMITPNLFEAEQLVGHCLKSYCDIEKAAKELLMLGVKNVLIKGGHFQQNAFCQDYWTDGEGAAWLAHPRYDVTNYRGTGCTFSTAIAAALSLNYDIKDAIVIAQMYVARGIRLATKIDNTTAALFHQGWPENEEDLPYWSQSPVHNRPPSFQPCSAKNLGLYPIVNSAAWLKKLLPLGVPYCQLRIKNKQGKVLEDEIKNSIKIANYYGAKLFINDYWELALRYQAYGVHLGQADLNTADIGLLRISGLRLGISTHCYYEVARAHAYAPSYIACGPIFPTLSKLLPFSPQGIAQLARWRRSLNYTLVAIGGIDYEKIPAILQCGVGSIAVMSAITKAKCPITMAQLLLSKMKLSYVTTIE